MSKWIFSEDKNQIINCDKIECIYIVDLTCKIVASLSKQDNADITLITCENLEEAKKGLEGISKLISEGDIWKLKKE